MTTDPIPTTTDNFILEELMPAYACPIRQADEQYQNSLERGEYIAEKAKIRAADVWYDQKELLLALDDYCLTANDIKAIQSLHYLATASQPISPAVFQQAILTALAGMNERVTEYAQDLIEMEEYFS